MFDLQPENLFNENVKLVPLQLSDFEQLFAVACDPKIWEQHPNPNRYLQEDFKVFFDGAILSKAAFIILDTKTNEVIGSSRYYDFNANEKSIFIGYTFIGTKFWGKKINTQIKNLMVKHAFKFIDKIYFQIGADNLRSQIAIERYGATKIGEEEIEYYGETSKLNFIYEIAIKN